jgi:alanyl-tRNA synthetase
MKDESLHIAGSTVFMLFDTFGFPKELTAEEAYKRGLSLHKDWERDFNFELEKQRERSRTAGVGQFKGGLADQSADSTKLHTATHLMYQAMREVLGDHVEQKGANITPERIRFDFSHPEKVNPEQIAQIEKIVNEKIAEDLPVTWEEMDKDQALKVAHGSFSDRYGDRVKVYSIGDYSIEVCGGPHVQHTGELAEGGKKFKIIKEENSSAGVRRFKAVLG